ncbi:ATP-binding protein [Deltaproteobacteria bacterium PRO3]|nr:ATP-binding protein [Deltaproteobacteria bacterium PRO3]
MKSICKRLFELNLPANKSAFLWGPRKVGKSYWIRTHLPEAKLIDLLQTEVFAEYASRPSLLRERFQNHRGILVIDEVQKIPALLDEVHWLIENKKISFLLTGSSARKLKRGHANLLGGRAWRRQMRPLSIMETEGFDLESAMVSGLLPPHFLSPHPKEELRAYVADYLKEEVAAEALTQNIPAFSEFLRVAAITSSELLNYANVARESGVSPKVVRTYFDILEDTYLGFRIPPWTKARNRRLIETEKFYLFDVGVANFLARREPKLKSAEFGKSFEHYLLMELMAFQAYRNPEMEVRFWRASTGQEVDFILGDMEVAIEIKAGERVHETDARGLRALLEDRPVRKSFLISFEPEPRRLGDKIQGIHWKTFLEQLWGGEIF